MVGGTYDFSLLKKYYWTYIVRLFYLQALDWLKSNYWEPQRKAIPDVQKEIRCRLREMIHYLKAKYTQRMKAKRKVFFFLSYWTMVICMPTFCAPVCQCLSKVCNSYFTMIVCMYSLSIFI